MKLEKDGRDCGELVITINGSQQSGGAVTRWLYNVIRTPHDRHAMARQQIGDILSSVGTKRCWGHRRRGELMMATITTNNPSHLEAIYHSLFSSHNFSDRFPSSQQLNVVLVVVRPLNLIVINQSVNQCIEYSMAAIA